MQTLIITFLCAQSDLGLHCLTGSERLDIAKKTPTLYAVTKTDQHAHLISLNDPQIHASGKNNENYNQ